MNKKDKIVVGISIDGANLMGIVNGLFSLIPKKKKNKLSKKESKELLKNKILT